MREKIITPTCSLLIIYILMSLYLSANLPGISGDILPDPRTHVFDDSSEYGGLGDVGSLSVFTNTSHIVFQVNYEGNLPNSSVHFRMGDIFIDTDRNRSTGQRREQIGADCRLDFDIFGTGTYLADIAYWNSTSFRFIEEYGIITDIKSDKLMLQVPLTLLVIDNETSIDFQASFSTQIRDFVFDTATYTLNGLNNITVDGNIDDWEGIPPILFDPVEEYEEQSDITDFYTSDNSSHLFHRFDVRGDMPTRTPQDIVHSGILRIYYDADNNSDTGEFRNEIGAEYLLLINTERQPSGEQTASFGYLHEWDEEIQDWDWPNKTYFTSIRINSTFEFSLPLSQEGIHTANNTIRILVASYNSEIHDSVPNKDFLTYIPPIIEVDDSYIADNRVDLGSSQQVWFHASWSTGKNMTTGTVYVNGSGYEVNSTGWIAFNVRSYEVVSNVWTITNASALGVRRFNQTADNPRIVWDEVEIEIPKGQRVDLGSDIPLRFAHYSYDGAPFEGSIFLNDTMIDKEVGKYPFKVVGIKDSIYNLTVFDSKDFQLIMDIVQLELSISDTRVDVSTKPKLTISSFYMYDSIPFDGTINVIYPKLLSNVKDHTYYVSNISDQFGMTIFNSNNVTCIWDMVLITNSELSNNELEVGETGRVWYEALYAYDRETFDEKDGVLYVNWYPCNWDNKSQRWYQSVTSESAGSKAYVVTKIDDNNHGLTWFQDNADILKINWIEKGWVVPAYPLESILTGLVITVVILFYLQKNTLDH